MITLRAILMLSLALLIIPYEGVVPPSGIPAQSSTLSAPPSCAAMQLATELAHISNLYIEII
jgi:hypothetical protein